MKFENFITQYLETSRILFKKENSKEKVFKMLKEGYNLSFSYFRCLLELKVNLIVTYSMNRVCETGKYGDQLFIIYDHYLGQTFNLLNNIYYSSHNPKDIYIYINKVISEYFYIKWRPDISKLYNENYLNLFKKWKGYTFKTAKDEDRKKRILSIPIQEAFVIAHELYHMFIEVTLNKNYILLKKRNTILEIIKIHENFVLKNDSKIREEDYFAPERKFMRLFYGEDIDLRDQDFINNRNIKKKLVKSNDEFIYELISDEWATIITIMFMKTLKVLDFKKTFEAIYLAFLHLRTLKMIEEFVGSHFIEDNSNMYSEYLSKTFVREFQYRFITIIKLMELFGECRARELLDILISVNRKYAEKIFDPILLFISSLKRSIKVDNIKSLSKKDYEKYFFAQESTKYFFQK